MGKVKLILFILFVEFFDLILSVSVPCGLNFGLNITNGIRYSRGSINFNGTWYHPGDYEERDGITIGCLCRIKPCLRKCCPSGTFFENGGCVPTNKTLVIPESKGFPIDFYQIVYGNKCRENKQRLLQDSFYIDKRGRMVISGPKGIKFYDPDSYCVDYIEDDSEIQALSCSSDIEKFRFTVWGMIISMPFLLLTFLVYAVLPDRNLHGKCLMCYVSTLFGAYALLIFIQLYPDTIEPKACKALGIVCLFFFMVSFFWMSVMSIDIFLAFSGRRGFSGSRKQAEMKRFLLYNLYAWGMPLILVIIVTSLSVATNINANAWYNPGIGAGQCWFADGFPTMLYFYLPISLIIITNITLFGTTACKIKRVQQDTAMLRKDESKKHSYENDKQRFNLYVKLLLAMGVNWSMEIISWLIDWRIGSIPAEVWYLTDFCNALYGVFVFFIFVFKPNIWKLLKKRYYVMIGKPNLARTLTQSAYSRRTTGSSLNHTISNDKSFANDSSVLTSEVA